jgi:branched-chain amino acid transport system permease protein
LTALFLGALPSSIAGCIFAWALTYINPAALFGVEVTFMAVTMAMLGGTGFFAGPILGCVFISVIQEVLWTQVPYLHLAVYGAILIFVGLYMPGGVTRTRPFRKALSAIGFTERLYLV